MDRKAKLLRLIDQHCAGNKKAFAQKIGRSPAQLSQWVSGHRAIGDAGARIIETALNLPQGYFDDNFVQSATDLYAAEPVAQPYAAVVKIPKKTDPLIAEVISIMENTDATGRAMALAAIKVALSGYKPAKANPAS